MSDVVAMLPNDFGYVLVSMLGCYITMSVLGGSVMKARKECGVEYPNLYATTIEVNGKQYTNAKDPKLAEKFNSCQRGHMNGLEHSHSVMVLAIAGGLFQPKLAALGLASWSAGAYFYACNYRDQGAKARNNNLALLKYVGVLAILGANISGAYTLLTR